MIPYFESMLGGLDSIIKAESGGLGLFLYERWALSEEALV